MKILAMLVALGLLQYGRHSPFLSLFEDNRLSKWLPFVNQTLAQFKLPLPPAIHMLATGLLFAFGLAFLNLVLSGSLFMTLVLGLLNGFVLYLCFSPNNDEPVGLMDGVLAPVLWGACFGVPVAILYVATTLIKEDDTGRFMHQVLVYPVSKLYLLAFAVVGNFSVRHLASPSTWQSLEYDMIVNEAYNENFGNKEMPFKVVKMRLVIAWAVFMILAVFALF